MFRWGGASVLRCGARQQRWAHGGRRAVGASQRLRRSLLFTHENRIWSSSWRRGLRLPAVRVVSGSVLSSLPGLDSPVRGRPSDKSLGFFRPSLRDGFWYRSDAGWRGLWNRECDSPRAGRRDPPARRAIELSPAIHRWEKEPPVTPSPGGATESACAPSCPASRPASRAEPTRALRGAGRRRTCPDRILVGKAEDGAAPSMRPTFLSCPRCRRRVVSRDGGRGRMGRAFEVPGRGGTRGA